MKKIKTEEVELTERELELKEVMNTTDLYSVETDKESGGKTNYGLTGFSGDNHSASIRLAFEWMDRVNSDSKDWRQVTLHKHFKQAHTNKSILVSYKIEKKEGFSDEV